MSELLPSREAAQIRAALTDYLTTTFALSDLDAQRALTEFLTDPDAGIFRGPFVRARIPFRAAEDGWQGALGWYEGHTPYGHQAEAFRRLSSANLGEQPDGSIKEHPLPTLVVTGTGSGKTEAFLYPILDHVLREKAAGREGVKALILYPMNALANDQARRIAEMIRGHDSLKGIRAALYTGEQGGAKRTRVTADGLINHRETIRDDAPDILLTNYKMLDQVLLRPADRPLVEAMAQGLQYLVLDEFHTYDGAQGTDVAMLLRRLGLALRRARPVDRASASDLADFPLGDITPVATSATLGDDGDPSGMLTFAVTVFGRPFPPDSVVTETRQSVRLWIQNALAAGKAPRVSPAALNNALAAAVASTELPEEATSAQIAAAVLDELYPPDPGHETPSTISWDDLSDADLLAAVAGHPLTHALARASEKSISLDDLADELLPPGLGTDETFESRRELRRVFLTRVFAMLSHVRTRVGRAALSIDLSLWVRELTRIDRAASPIVRFSWSDDGPSDALLDDGDAPLFPAIYCRHCGRSGWGVELAPTGTDLAADDDSIRRNHASRETRSRFRALLHAPGEAESAEAGTPVTGLAWFDPQIRRIAATQSDDDGSTGRLPVLTLTGDDASDQSRDDVCPSCQRRDGIRFLGSAMATMLSVIVTTLFGDAQLDRAEKKSLIFTDSVQDAAHRAGFVQSRAHVFALRNAIRQAVGDQPAPLDEIVNLMVKQAGDDKDARYRLVAPELVERELFSPFWSSATLRQVPPKVLGVVKRRLLFDVAMEFGLHSRVGRTLELTGSLAAGVDASDTKLESLGRSVLAAAGAETLDGLSAKDASSSDVIRWVRGVLERMRERGAIEHEWLTKYITEDGRRWHVSGGRPRGTGMPAFPTGREAPAFPRVGPHAPAGNDGTRTHLDVVSSSQSWFATWARRTLSVTSAEGATLTAALLAELAKDGLLRATEIATGSATVYAIPPASVIVAPVTDSDLQAGATRLVCDVCQNPVTGTAIVIAALRDGPCMSARCPGTLRTAPADKNYYRELYDDGQMRRVVAREHTGLLETDTRLTYENAFKASDENPSAPNVLVATPTLEMGIDIGDLSTVMLAGLPRSVASYLQRVGRAGRLTGNALSVATVTGRGDQLPRMGDPLSVINGAVRPPATYLDAQEILQRQYIASLVDRRTGTGDLTAEDLRDVLASSEPGTLLGDLIDDADTHHETYIGEFLGALPQLTEQTADRLRSFATPTDGVGTSPLAGAVYDAVQRWNKQIEIIVFRRKEIADAIPDLEAAQKLGLESDAEEALRTAQITHRMLGRQLHELHTDHWIAALERFGLLPNYTLLDDSVTLDAAISWVDPETGEWQEDPVSYRRGASVAIHELAPGAYFYAQGMEILIDAVDLGPGGEAVEEWAFCAQCGHSRNLASSADDQNACPRCGAKGMNDVAQRLRVVELDRVSAVARRDEASIGDRSDDRIRTRFTVQVAADLDPAGVARRWFDEETHFGVTYARDLTIRWVNLGRRSAGGEPRIIAGQEHHAPLFRVCDTCGKQDMQAGGNDRRDHRSWCPRRLETQEHTIPIALGRTLVTQGTFLRLPIGITLGDTLAVPSLSAALMRGLREVMGGDPDHLRVIPTVEPVAGDATAESLLVHDAVPGGTGYLAELADPAQMFELLDTAWRIVRDCECRTEQRVACHRCLLPYAVGNATLVSRASAEQALRRLLRVDDNGEAHEFVPVEADPGVVLDESTIEQLFRKRFIERARKVGGTVKEKPGDWGNKVQVSFPGDARIWMLSPQVSLGFTRPDFVLEQHGGGAQPIAIYTDGKAFHASALHNRLADDAEKRRLAREGGHRVVAVTWADLQDDTAPSRDWFDQAFAERVAQMYQLPLVHLDRIHTDPLTMLMEWMQDPAAEGRRRDKVARALPMMTGPRGRRIEPSATPRDAAAATLRDDPPAGSDDPGMWVVRQGAVAFSTRMGSQGHSEFALMIDDRDEAVSTDDFVDAWRLWLHLSNIIGWRDDLAGVEILALSQVGGVAPVADIGVVDMPVSPIAVEWQALSEAATSAERRVIARLATVPDMPVPTMGVELGDGIPFSFVWERLRVAATTGLTDEDREELTSSGWKVLDADADDIIDVLTQAGRN